MIVEIKVPSPGESISEVEIGKWLVENGAVVRKDQELAEVESDKATLSLIATAAGQLSILASEGDRVNVGSVACTIDTDKASSQPAEIPVVAASEQKKSIQNTQIEKDTNPIVAEQKLSVPKEAEKSIKMTPTAKAVMEQSNMSVDEVLEGIRRLTRTDMEQIVMAYVNPVSKSLEANRSEDRITMTPLRRKLAQRLVAVKNETAMLTTFNEVDMSKVMELRTIYQKAFTEKYGYKLGFNAFFAKAVSMALSQHPSINSMIDGEEMVIPNYHDIGIAVSSPKGLMVPIIRNVESMNIAMIEGAIKDLAEKARDKRLTVQEMTGGTFTITNGGVFGSMMSTPIINPPQSAILGLHAIKDRPVAIDGKVEIRPMMYIALSYDHRIIDGKDSVGFLVKVKELIENPVKLLFEGKDAGEILLDL
ncbi:MAG: 2-oxoglutarate dehydrogenase complex dihydrolipoyllysine-residue succinyltransferase [Prolixibacteraceae bacterium]|jgi:2-oxoglutarate dehydrogenase E2 component (dihydrolipoamide succinyltransferase)|nr:2-oxoglutarate dehydrogenase complex dihydrolipoyllysine-residue succinyltransferase [Prolixibacteraceae bacterium]